MPANQVALLRGINVGGAKRIAMSDLRDAVSSLGYGDVRTLLASGNVVYATRAAPTTAAARIQAAIESHCGVRSRVVSLTSADVARIVDENPLGDDDPSHLMIGVLYDPADRVRLQPVAAQTFTGEHMVLGTRAVYYRRLLGVVDSPLTKAIGKVVRDGITTRNYSTMCKIRDALGA